MSEGKKMPDSPQKKQKLKTESHVQEIFMLKWKFIVCIF